ncbi:MAG: DNA cytosine methyltransferase [Prevotella sp.]|nr:DNA cytosine methyltransferase [Prevotella sp.]
MAKKKEIKLSKIPEEITKDGLKIYGPASYETQVAILSHYLHTLDGKHDIASGEKRYEILGAIHDYLEYKKQSDKSCEWKEIDEESVATMVTEGIPLQYDLFSEFFSVPFPAPKNPKFTFIDLFAGIGGFRIAMQELGGKCVYSSEFDAQAQRTYFANYGDMPFGDITKEVTKSHIPDGFDILCGGFPCQAFSLAGKRLGFEDETRGTLFFEIEDILRRKQPKAFFLENVKGLMIHKGGQTIRTILEHLDDAGYDVVPPQIVNAMDFGVPQHRERVYIIGFRKDLHIDISKFQYPEPQTAGDKRPRFRDVMEENEVSVKYYLSTTYMDTLIRHKARHEAAGHGFGYKIIDLDGVANAIVVGGMGRECNLIIDKRLTNFTPVTNIKGEVNRDGIRKMTPREWARLQGFPEKFKIVVADASAYKQFGNSVAVPAIKATAEKELSLLGLI